MLFWLRDKGFILREKLLFYYLLLPDVQDFYRLSNVISDYLMLRSIYHNQNAPAHIHGHIALRVELPHGVHRDGESPRLTSLDSQVRHTARHELSRLLADTPRR